MSELGAVLNVRMEEDLKKKLAELARALGSSLTDLVEEAVEEKVRVAEAARESASASIPAWVPTGKYVALVKGAVAAVGDSVAEVVAETLTKFRDEPVQVSRKGEKIPEVHYAFFAAKPGIHCWKYLRVGDQSYPIVPATITGGSRVTVAATPDTGSSVTLLAQDLVNRASLEREGEVKLHTPTGPVTAPTFKARVELPTGTYDAIVASTEIPKALPFRMLLGRNVLDRIDLYAFGKSSVVSLKDP